MELYHLISFKTVADEKHLTRAAEKLFISQSALSAQIIALEKDLGTPLFRRTARGMELTDCGKLTLEYANKIIDLAYELKSELLGHIAANQNRLKIGLQTDPTFLKIDSISKDLENKISNMDINYTGIRSELTPDLLIKRKIDLGFAYGDIINKHVRTEKLFSVPTRIVIPKKIY